jgi:hypothetical protein
MGASEDIHLLRGMPSVMDDLWTYVNVGGVGQGMSYDIGIGIITPFPD